MMLHINKVVEWYHMYKGKICAYLVYYQVERFVSAVSAEITLLDLVNQGRKGFWKGKDKTDNYSYYILNTLSQGRRQQPKSGGLININES